MAIKQIIIFLQIIYTNIILFLGSSSSQLRIESDPTAASSLRAPTRARTAAAQLRTVALLRQITRTHMKAALPRGRTDAQMGAVREITLTSPHDLLDNSSKTIRIRKGGGS